MSLQIQNFSAAYRKKPVLEDLSFTVEDGTITALIGSNGVGKTTLIRCLTGEKRDYQGTLLLDGLCLRDMPPSQRATQIACLPQDLPRPHVTVRELVSFGRAPYTPLTEKLSKKDEAQIHWAMETADVSDLWDRFVDTLSGGQRKKAFLAMVLAQDTPLIILDEPTAHVDTASRFQIMALLEKLRREQGKTFLVVMHELPEVLRCAHRIIALSDGKLVFDGTPTQCLTARIPQTYFQVTITGTEATGYAVLPLENT